MAATKTTRKTTSTKASTKEQAAPTRDITGFAQQAAYAYAGLLNDVVTVAADAPNALPRSPEELSSRVRSGVDQARHSVTTLLDTKATEGREVVDDLRKRPEVAKVTDNLQPVLDQAGNTRSQVKAAVTSVTRTVNAYTQGATTQFGTVAAQGRRALTSLVHVGGAATEAARKQAGNARTQVKAARTSTRKTVDAAVQAGRNLAE